MGELFVWFEGGMKGVEESGLGENRVVGFE